MAWTDVQLLVFLIFWRLMSSEVDKSEAIFFALRSDHAQRQVTKQLARVLLSRWPDTVERVVAAINKAGGAAGSRNAVIHALWVTNHPDLSVSIWPGTSSLEGKDVKTEIEKSIGEFDNISHELHRVMDEVSTIMEGKPAAPNLAGIITNALLPAPDDQD